MVVEELPAKINLRDNDLEESILGTDIKILNVSVQVIFFYFKTQDLEIDWEKVKVLDLEDNSFGILLKHITIVMNLKMRIDPPLGKKTTVNISVILSKASVVLQVKNF